MDAKLFFDTKENNHILFLDFNSFPNWNFFTGNGFYAQDISKNKLYHNYTSVKDIVKINDTIVGIASTGYAGKMNLKNISKDDFQHNFIENLRAKSCAYSPKTKVLFVATNKGLFSINGQNKILKIENRKQDVFAKKLLLLIIICGELLTMANYFVKLMEILFFITEKKFFKI